MSVSETAAGILLPDTIVRHPVNTNCRVVVGQAPPHELTQFERDDIERIWNDEYQSRGHSIFDGPIFSVTSLTESCVTVIPASYKPFIAQVRIPDMFSKLKIQPLAITVVTTCADGFVFGQRSESVAVHSFKWEVGPSGTVDSENAEPGSVLDVMAVARRELDEELALSLPPDASLDVIAAFEDKDLHCFDLVMRADTGLGRQDVMNAFGQRSTAEYRDIAVVSPKNVIEFVKSDDRRWTPASLHILSALNVI
jgi:8-oxo-dGTP pyrophosphatase MutT (NUDIX family)